MTYLTNRKQIVDTVLFGLGEVVDSHIYLFRPEYDKSLVSYPFDPEKALALLNEAGWKDTDGDGMLDKVIDGNQFRCVLKSRSTPEIRYGKASRWCYGRAQESWHRGQRASVGLDDISQRRQESSI